MSLCKATFNIYIITHPPSHLIAYFFDPQVSTKCLLNISTSCNYINSRSSNPKFNNKKKTIHWLDYWMYLTSCIIFCLLNFLLLKSQLTPVTTNIKYYLKKCCKNKKILINFLCVGKAVMIHFGVKLAEVCTNLCCVHEFAHIFSKIRNKILCYVSNNSVVYKLLWHCISTELRRRISWKVKSQI